MPGILLLEPLTADNLTVRLDWVVEDSNRMRLLWRLRP
jgi:hypothetical protein